MYGMSYELVSGQSPTAQPLLPRPRAPLSPTHTHIHPPPSSPLAGPISTPDLWMARQTVRISQPLMRYITHNSFWLGPRSGVLSLAVVPVMASCRLAGEMWSSVATVARFMLSWFVWPPRTRRGGGTGGGWAVRDGVEPSAEVPGFLGILSRLYRLLCGRTYQNIM